MAQFLPSKLASVEIPSACTLKEKLADFLALPTRIYENTVNPTLLSSENSGDINGMQQISYLCENAPSSSKSV
jgi:hypothetical protein